MKTEENPPTDIDQKLEASKRHFEDNHLTPSVGFDALAKFLTESFGSRDTINLALNYSPDLTKLVDMLKKIYDHITDNALKSRIKRILRKLENSCDTSTSETSATEE